MLLGGLPGGNRRRKQNEALTKLRKRYQGDANKSTLVLALRHGHAELIERALPDMLIISPEQASELYDMVYG
jgi:hypothetical protein